jgi:uncharacterized protein
MKNGILAHLSPFAKLMFLIMLMISCFLITMIGGIFLAMPVFHVNLFSDFSALTDVGNPDTGSLLKFFQVLQEIGLFIFPAWLAAWFFSGRPGHYSGLDRPASFLILIMVGILLFISLPFNNWIAILNEHMKLPGFLGGMEQWMKEAEDQAGQVTDLFLDVKTVGGFFINLLMIAVLPALGEELVFRGVLQRLFREWFRNNHVAIITAAVLFGVVHMQFYGVLPRILLGLMFGYLYLWSGSLWVPVFAHFLNNGAAVVVAWLSSRGLVNINYEQFGATENPLLITGSLLLTAALLVTIRYRCRMKQQDIVIRDNGI